MPSPVGAQGGPVHPLGHHAGGLATAIITGNEKVLWWPRASGKTAQRIILELKDKLAQGPDCPGEESYGGTGVTVIPKDKAPEATAALAVLGYGPAEITAALKGLDLETSPGGDRPPGPEKHDPLKEVPYEH